ncbi:PP2C family protein-serine/threonine phosphatase [Microbacterium foliorum]|uniref:PP2C family protein-serine/threonine phosphatase n=1 Tax=Microbacterium foliorum TaxID=104336 RepID=UPI001DA76967|nr:protein phosphatase 2C domain-containing protein [Microbacterium foliorum]CAH0230897.1 Serine/threonine phosphatase stp [Microbacterium foliorum]CAH0236725.1 Serine/threonine phosphatase stp [Microbacterium foliorum]
MRSALVVTSGSATHIGLRRALNEDSLLAEAPVFIVADGMGGHEAGEHASARVIEEFSSFIGRSSLTLGEVRGALDRARAGVEDLSTGGNGRAGTTLSGVMVASVDGTGYWLAVNIGDSRTYRLADGELEQISVDHSVVQELVESGELTPAEAATDRRRNIITRAIGGSSTGDADYWLFPAEEGDRILVCSDGITSELSDQRISEILSRVPDPQLAADALIAEALQSGGHDNITVVIVDAVRVSSRPGGGLESDEFDIDVDTLPRAAGGVR